MGRSKEFLESFNEAEMSSKSNPKLHKQVMDKIAKKKYDSDAEYHLGLVKAMNPKKLSRSDLDTLNDFNDMYESLDEGQHYNTKIRQVESKRGSRHIRLGMQEYRKMVEKMLDPKSKAPNPADRDSQIKLQECNFLMERSIKRLKEVKDSKKAPQFEAVSKSDLKFLKDDAIEALQALKAEGSDIDIKDVLKKVGIK